MRGKRKNQWNSQKDRDKNDKINNRLDFIERNFCYI